MVNIFKLDWKHFLLDLIQDPGITFRRVVSILGQGTSARKAEVIYSALIKKDSGYWSRYPEEMAEVEKMPRNQIPVVPYPLKGISMDIKVEKDEQEGLLYIVHDRKRLYFPRSMSVADAELCYRSLMEGEDIFGRGRVKSPHCYEDDNHKVCEGDVVVDVGSAEGLFALDVAEKASRIYLFEQLPRWDRPLKLSFAPYAEKTVIVNKLVADKTDGDAIRLSDAIKDDKAAVYFLKMDIEGWEKNVLEASSDFLCSHKVKVSCCVYHRQRDAEEISAFLAGIGFRVRFSDGFMLPPLDRIEAPYFRKGVIYAQNF